MIQVVLKDGTKKRFTEKIIGIDPKDIDFQKVLTEDEIEMAPEKNGNKWELKKKEKVVKELTDAEKKQRIIYLKMKIIAGESEGYNMNVEQTQLDNIKG